MLLEMDSSSLDETIKLFLSHVREEHKTKKINAAETTNKRTVVSQNLQGEF